MLRFVFVSLCVLAACCGTAAAAQYLEADAVSEAAPTEVRGVADVSTSVARCLSCGSSAGSSSVSRGASGTSISGLMFLHWTGTIDVLFDVLLRQIYVDCSWAEIKLCYKYPPGHESRPACCDGDHPPKDPVPPSGG